MPLLILYLLYFPLCHCLPFSCFLFYSTLIKSAATPSPRPSRAQRTRLAWWWLPWSRTPSTATSQAAPSRTSPATRTRRSRCAPARTNCACSRSMRWTRPGPCLLATWATACACEDEDTYREKRFQERRTPCNVAVVVSVNWTTSDGGSIIRVPRRALSS